MLRQRYRTRGRVDRLADPPRRRAAALRQRVPASPLGSKVAVAIVTMIVVGMMFGPLAILLTGLGALAARHWWNQRIAIATSQRRREQLPLALERMAAALRTGSSLAHSLADAGHSIDAPLGPELAELVHAAEGGRPLLDVLDGWTDAHNDTGTRLAATALALAAGVGAAPARAIDGVAATLRERLAQATERRAQASQARYSAVVLSAAPLVFTGLLVVTNSAAAQFLLRTPAGWTCLIIGLGLDALGAVWMMRLIQAGERS